MNEKPRLVYDGICNLCVNAVRLVNLLDRRTRIEYCPFQEIGPAVRRKYGLRVEALEGRMHLVQEDGSVLAGSDAIEGVCRLIMPFKFMCNVFSSSPVRRLYEFLAQRRYRIFGFRGSCYSVSSKDV